MKQVKFITLFMLCAFLSLSSFAQRGEGEATQAFAGINLMEELDLILPGYADLPANIDEARRTNDIGSLYLHSMTLKNLEDIAGKESDKLNSDMVFDIAHEMLTDEENAEMVTENLLKIARAAAKDLDKEEESEIYADLSPTKSRGAGCTCYYNGYWYSSGSVLYFSWGYMVCEYGYAGCDWYLYY